MNVFILFYHLCVRLYEFRLNRSFFYLIYSDHAGLIVVELFRFLILHCTLLSRTIILQAKVCVPLPFRFYRTSADQVNNVRIPFCPADRNTAVHLRWGIAVGHDHDWQRTGTFKVILVTTNSRIGSWTELLWSWKYTKKQYWLTD